MPELEVDDLEPVQQVSFAADDGGRRRPSVSSMSDLFLDAATELEMQSPSNAKAQALFGSLESLAEAASKLILCGHVDQALQLLETAFSSVADSDREVALAGVGVQILLCAALSQAGRHEEALDIAQHAVQIGDTILEQLEEPREIYPEAPEADAETGDDVPQEASLESLTAPLALLQRALELAVQSRQCQALEMEFLGPKSEEIGLDFWQKLMVLHDECLELAQGLPKSSNVRQRAEQSKREWQLRAADATLPKLSPASSGALQAWRCMLGLPPAVDLEFERLRRHPSFPSSIGELPASTASSTFMEKGYGSMSAQTLSSWSTSSSLSGSGSKPISRHQLPRGDIYVHTSPRRSELPRTPNWSSARRVPTEKGMQYFQDNLKKESYRFKNSWLKDVVTQEDLYSDRTFFCSEGLRVLKKNPRRQPRPISPLKPQVRKLFDHYGISCPHITEPTSLHLQVASYAELLQKSQKQAKLHNLPYHRGHGRRLDMGLGHFDALRIILRKHRRTAVLPCLVEAFRQATNFQKDSVTPSEAGDFVRFCVAYRIHCYFETSLLTPAIVKPAVVFVLGGPGAGKGTQCERISQRKRQGSEYGQLIESFIKEGKLVPVEIVVNLLKQAMEKRGWSQGKFLVDGFPRSFENMEGWKEVLGGKVNVKFALFFDCSEAVMEARILERGKTSGRADDNSEAIRKRLATFKEESSW
eukprot:g7884.t1